MCDKDGGGSQGGSFGTFLMSGFIYTCCVGMGLGRQRGKAMFCRWLPPFVHQATLEDSLTPSLTPAAP